MNTTTMDVSTIGFNYGDKKIQVVIKNDEPWFVSQEVCELIGIENARDAMSRLDEDEKIRLQGKESLVGLTDNPNITQLTIVSEPGLYALIARSRKQEAKLFDRWVRHEVLPSIRKHGGYLTPQKIEEALLNPDILIQLATQLKQEREARRQLEAKAAQDRPKVIFAEALETSENTVLVGELAKLLRQNGIEIGQNRLFEQLRQDGYLMKTKDERWNDPTQRSMDLEIFEIKKRTINNPDGSVRVIKTTKVTGKGQIYFINKFKEA